MSELTTRSTATQSELIDRLFERLAAMYGRQWFDLWADVPMADVKDAWSEGLRSFSPFRIKGALDACGKFAPSLPEFTDLCRKAPADPRHCSQSAPLTLLGAPSRWSDPLPFADKRGDGRDWARRILHRINRGEHVPIAAALAAKEALTAPVIAEREAIQTE